MRPTFFRLLTASALTAVLAGCVLPPVHHDDAHGRVVHAPPPRVIYGQGIIYATPDRHDERAWRAHERLEREREARELEARRAEMLRAQEREQRARERERERLQREREREQAQHLHWQQERRESLQRQERDARRQRGHDDPRGDERRAGHPDRDDRRGDWGGQPQRWGH